jgi:O-antigen/teichoic acid export membrane protein
MAGFGFLLRRLGLVALGAGALGVLVAWAGGGPLLGLCYGPEYAAHGRVLTVLMTAAAAIYLSSLLGHALTAVRQIDVQLPLSIVFTATTALACIVLVPARGLSGAAWAVMVAAVLQLPPKTWLLVRSLRRRPA